MVSGVAPHEIEERKGRGVFRLGLSSIPVQPVLRHSAFVCLENEEMEKLACDYRRCGWAGESIHAISAHITSEDSRWIDDEKILICPQCQEVGTLVGCCDAKGCREPSTCGVPTVQGYMRLCSKHMNPSISKATEGAAS